MNEDKLIQKATGIKVCEIQEHFGLTTLEYNPVNHLMKSNMKMNHHSMDNRPVKIKDDRSMEIKEDHRSVEMKKDRPIEKKNVLPRSNPSYEKHPETDNKGLRKSDVSLNKKKTSGGDRISGDGRTPGDDKKTVMYDHHLMNKENAIETANGSKKRDGIWSRLAMNFDPGIW